MSLIALIQEKMAAAVRSEYNIDLVDIHVEHPINMKFGDYSTNVPLVLSGRVGEAPLKIGPKLKASLEKSLEKSADSLFAKITVDPPGFINFTLSTKYLIESLSDIVSNPETFGSGDLYAGKKVVVEYTDPNPFKVFHIGHLMPNVIGEALSRLIENQSAEIKRANYQGDVGVHVAKALWGLQKELAETGTSLDQLEQEPLGNRVSFLGKSYARGANAFVEDVAAQEEIKQLNKKIYDKDPEIIDLYTKGRSWSLDYFETLYSRLGTKFDFYYFERESGEMGLKVANQLLDKGTLEKSDGALVFRGDNYGLHTRVFVNSLGLPTYEAKDLGLAKTKYDDFPYDLSVIVTANEIDDYFKVVLKAMEFVYPELAAKTKHVSHGILKLRSGKMSSRTGKIIAGDALMNRVRDVVLQRMDDKDAQIADSIAIAAIKYGILKSSIGGDIVFDEDTWLSLTGDTGPYLQYTCARAHSVLAKSTESTESGDIMGYDFNADELLVLRTLYMFPEIACRAALDFAPHGICSYLNDLASKYNTFYSNNRILDAPDKSAAAVRLLITEATCVVISRGLWLLGITVPERM